MTDVARARGKALFQLRSHVARPRPIRVPPREVDPPRQVGLIVHSLASNPGRIVNIARRVTQSIGAQLWVEFTSLAEPGRTQTVRLRHRGIDSLVVAGGDGTIRQSIEELVGSELPLGIVPVGSGNVLAAALGLTGRRMPDQIRSAICGSLADIDVGEVTCLQGDGQLRGPFHFCCMAGIGRDARTVQSTPRAAKKVMGPLAYGMAGLGQILRSPMSMSWRVDDGDWHQGRDWTVLATNTPLVPGAHIVPGGVVLARDARMDDGRLDVVAVAPHRPDEWIGIAAKGLLGSTSSAPGLQYAQGVSVQVRSAVPVAVQADGDIVSTHCSEFSAGIVGQVCIRVP
ncbi:diacylglycerol/lipid kinase family protein [Propionibacterium sp.]|uniref:diacylglycerol/lipid kinase family protein n=1 Tax=Propionibacterium sp. TaxID=1977903 RepID=UPI0039EC87AB